MNEQKTIAPGAPGEPATWTSGAKTGVGKALNAASEVMFTLSHGILNEVYYPREDIACIRECGCIVTDGREYLSEERDAEHLEKMFRSGIPAYRIRNSTERYTLTKEIIADPYRDTVLQKIRFTPLQAGEYKLYVYLTPHIFNKGMANRGWTGSYKDVPMLFAAHDGITMALACSSGWVQRSVGFAGVSDGVTDIRRHKAMTVTYTETGEGSIVLCGEIDCSAGAEVVLAIGFGHTPSDAGNQAWASLLDGYATARDRYIGEWEDWQKSLLRKRKTEERRGKLFKESAAVLRMNESKRFPGGIIASPSVPWGNARGDRDGIGYHLVWPRDLVESSWGFLALHAHEDCLRILNYLMSTQEPDGRWSQNMWLQGDAMGRGVQMDQVALPILLLDSCYHARILDKDRWARYFPGVKKAVAFLLARGPYTEQDRWEQQAGLSPFTLSTQIAALLAAAFLLERYGERTMARYLRETADYWAAQIDEWTYVTGTETARRCGVEGYYVRINPWYAPVDSVRDRILTVHHHPPGEGEIALGELVCVDALALVRFGLRTADDPRILNTVKVIDEGLRMETPFGPCWRRFTKDGYGEDAQGDPYVSIGTGRAWPLLTGERAHYEIAAGNLKGARELMKTMEGFAWNGLFPEQVWDEADKPEKGLFAGRYTGSSMPLTWAHAEYIKLGASLKEKQVFDMPLHTRKRYIEHVTPTPLHVWRFDRPMAALTAGRTVIRVEVLAPAVIRWTEDGWTRHRDEPTRDTGLGIHYADLVFAPGAGEVRFTFFWKQAGHWEGKDFCVTIAGLA